MSILSILTFVYLLNVLSRSNLMPCDVKCCRNWCVVKSNNCNCT